MTVSQLLVNFVITQWRCRTSNRIRNIIRNLVNYIISIDLMDLPWLCLCVWRAGQKYNETGSGYLVM
jgi:hypothetical protein